MSKTAQTTILKNRDEVSEPLYHLLATAKLSRLIEVRHVGQLVGIGQRADDFLVDLIADVRLAFEGDHVFEAGAGRDGDRRIRHASVLVAYVLDEKQDEDIVLVLAGIHAAAEFVAARPERRIKFRLLESHALRHPAMLAREKANYRTSSGITEEEPTLRHERILA
jgi:hypothetical protein